MADCGRCWLCATKFDCSGTDEGAEVTTLHDRWNDCRERTLCISCVEAIEGYDIDSDGPNEPHSDGVTRVDRLSQIISILATVAQRREAK